MILQSIQELRDERYNAQKEYQNICGYYLLESDERLKKIFLLDLKESKINHDFIDWKIKILSSK